MEKEKILESTCSTNPSPSCVAGTFTCLGATSSKALCCKLGDSCDCDGNGNAICCPSGSTGCSPNNCCVNHKQQCQLDGSCCTTCGINCCQSYETCSGGVCMCGTTQAACPAGETCSEGVCMCGTNSTCTDGLTCNSSKCIPCGNPSCSSTTETCSGTGPYTCCANGKTYESGGYTLCCEFGTICSAPGGSNCCTSVETCSNGVCCPSGQVYDNNSGLCCDPNACNSHCCNSVETCSNGMCCSSGQVYDNGMCCDPSVCNGHCCAQDEICAKDRDGDNARCCPNSCPYACGKTGHQCCQVSCGGNNAYCDVAC